MFTKLVRFADLSSDDVSRWRALVRSSPLYSSPFFAPSFTLAVSRHRDDVFVIVSGAEEHPEFFLPVQIYGAHADPIGAPMNDYHGPVVSSRWTGSLPAILKQVGVRSYAFTSLVNDYQVLGRSSVEREGAYVCDLAGGFDDFISRRNELFPKYMKNSRRLERRVQKDFGDFQFDFDDRNETDWSKTLNLKQRQYTETGRHNVLGVPWTSDLLWDLWRSGSSDCRVMFHSLRMGGELAAAEINLLGENTLHSWIVGYEKDFKDYAPGSHLHLKVAEAACQNGITTYDLGSTAGSYKKYFADYVTPVCCGVCQSTEDGVNSPSIDIYRKIERANIPKVSNLMGKVRRRYAVIRATETTGSGRVKGILSAMRRT